MTSKKQKEPTTETHLPETLTEQERYRAVDREDFEIPDIENIYGIDVLELFDKESRIG